MLHKVFNITQIFEWCQFMISSGKCLYNNTDCECQIQSMLTIADLDKLTDSEFLLLKEAYKQLLPRYSDLCLLYEAECRKSNLPYVKSFSEWSPLGGLQEGDQLLLQEPKNQVKFVDQFTIQDEITGRFITYISRKSQKPCSYIQLFNSANTATFGNIKACFTHQFADEATEFVLLNVYDCAHLDLDTNLWWVLTESTTHLQLISVKSLTAPLVVAHLKEGDNEKTWFLSA